MAESMLIEFEADSSLVNSSIGAKYRKLLRESSSFSWSDKMKEE